LQAAVDRADPSRYQAIILGYALCGNGIVGLRARQVPIVIPRAHDCICLFFGSKERRLDYSKSHTGVYYKTTGWLERGENPETAHQLSIPARCGMDATIEELTSRYGEENARYLFEELGKHTNQYRQMTFIEMGLESDARFERLAREQAALHGWDFEKERGDLGLIRRLADGEWSSGDFLMVPPDHLVQPSYDDKIITAVPAGG
jgi:hypothetical protein